ncbi:MAG: Crp/Fnr family transcriptional regulator [Cytophagaceae bacterium]|nr:MAG: Crp/Fnr family transcriptional regulator [Cytophagaceae bacterium]
MTLAKNALIERLPSADRTRLVDLCEQVPLCRTDCLVRPDEPIQHVYFPVEGFACLFAEKPSSSGLVVAMVGREGMLDARAVLGVVKTPERALVHGEGWAWRMPTEVFQRHLETSSALKRLMDRYVAVVLNQFSALALCLHYHEVDARLARWLLLNHDRTGVSHCNITQESLSIMLGVRRVSVTTAANLLQRFGAISYRRGDIRLLDRAVLEKVACNCYRADQESYEELMR